MNKLLTTLKENKKKVFIFGGIAILTIILLIILIVIFVNIFKRYDYQEIETIMVNETKNYLKRNPSLLPTEENPLITIEASTLINEKYMKDFSRLSKDSNCYGSINVIYNNGYIRYSPSLSCTNYETTSLYDTLLQNEAIVTESNGLYEMNNYYTYRGEYVNNYLNFANENWRILKFNENEIYLILSDTANKMDPVVFDDRYNESLNSNRGYNNFESSRIEESLTEIYNNFFANYKNYLLTMDACVHTRSENDYDNSGAIECYTTYPTPISLLPAYDYINASIDPLCKTVSSGNCTNYNYLSKASNDWWLLNGTNENTYDVYRVNTRGTIALERASVKNHLRVVIAIPSNILYKSGDGTQSNSYEIYPY